MPSAGALSKTDHLFSVSHRQHFESCMIARLSTRGLLVRFNQQWGSVMNTTYKIAMSVLVGAALGAAAVQGLHAQAKPKAYIVTDIEVLDTAANAAFTPLIQASQKAAGGRNLGTAGGKIVAFVGEAPKSVGIVEWDSLDAAVAWRNGNSWKDLSPQRDKAVKIIRQLAVEARN
jgi:uncharacterized protein (DUF1330 family)